MPDIRRQMPCSVPQLDAVLSERIRDCFVRGELLEHCCWRSLGVNDQTGLDLIVETAPCLSGPETLHDLLIDLFLRGMLVEAKKARGLLSTADWDALSSAGFLLSSDESVHSPVRIHPFLGLWIASDPRQHRFALDQVMWPTAQTRALAGIVTTLHGGRLLDIGSGGGALAIMGARHGAASLGIDNNPRAIAFARLNDSLNHAGAKFELADLVSSLPVAPTFDLIVSQPPYAPDPTFPAGSSYWAGGPSGTELLSRIITHASPLLADAPHAELRISAVIGLRNGISPESFVKSHVPAGFCATVTGTATDYAAGTKVVDPARYWLLQKSWSLQGIECFWSTLISIRRSHV